MGNPSQPALFWRPLGGGFLEPKHRAVPPGTPDTGFIEAESNSTLQFTGSNDRWLHRPETICLETSGKS